MNIPRFESLASQCDVVNCVVHGIIFVEDIYRNRPSADMDMAYIKGFGRGVPDALCANYTNLSLVTTSSVSCSAE